MHHPRRAQAATRIAPIVGAFREPYRPYSPLVVPPLLRLVEQLAADQHPPDLGGAGTDLIQLGVAPQAPGRIFVNVAVAAERLNRLTRHPRRLLGSVEYRTRGVLARHLAAIAGLRHCVNVRLAGIHRRVHVGDFALHELKLADALTELLTLVHVWQHDAHAGIHDPERPTGKHGTFVVDPAHQHVDATSFLREYVFFRNLAILELQLASIRPAHAELVELLRGRESLHALFDQERGDAARAGRAVRFGVDDQRIRVGPVGNPHLVAVEHKVVAAAIRAQTHRYDVGAGAGFAHGQCPDVFSGDELRQIFSLL